VVSVPGYYVEVIRCRGQVGMAWQYIIEDSPMGCRAMTRDDPDNF
jgi:hypothetical protein